MYLIAAVTIARHLYPNSIISVTVLNLINTHELCPTVLIVLTSFTPDIHCYQEFKQNSVRDFPVASDKINVLSVSRDCI